MWRIFCVATHTASRTEPTGVKHFLFCLPLVLAAACEEPASNSVADESANPNARSLLPGTYGIDSIPALVRDTIFGGEYQGGRYEWFGWRVSAWAKAEPCGPFESARLADTTLWTTQSQLRVTSDSIHSLIHEAHASWSCRQTVSTVIESWSRSSQARSDMFLPEGTDAIGLRVRMGDTLTVTLWF